MKNEVFFQPGTVVVKADESRVGVDRTMHERYKDAMVVLKRLGNNTWRCRHLETGEEDSFHPDKLKLVDFPQLLGRNEPSLRDLRPDWTSQAMRDRLCWDSIVDGVALQPPINRPVHFSARMAKLVKVAKAVGRFHRHTWKDQVIETPPILAKFLALYAKNSPRVVDLCAGSGGITEHIPSKCIVAVELNSERLKAGKQRCPGATWVQGDLLKRKWWHKWLFRQRGQHHRVVCNPPFELALVALLIGLELIRDVVGGKLIFLLPSDYFEAPERKKWYNESELLIEKRIETGCHGYYPDKPDLKKQFPDSVFILRQWKELSGEGIIKPQHAEVTDRSLEDLLFDAREGEMLP